MDTNINFSIIMPTYNRRNCICDAVDSILKQTYQNFELIIIDDCSDDGTESLINKRYAEEINLRKIQYIYLDRHQGVSAARNYGLRHARFEWISYCDTDNKWRDNYLDTFVASIIKHPKHKCFYAKLERQSTGTIFGIPDFNREKLLLGNYIDLGVFVNNRSLYEKYGGFDESLRRLVDLDLILTYTKHYNPIFIDKCVLVYNDTDKRKRISNTEDIETAWDYILKKHNENVTGSTVKVKTMFWLKVKRRLGLVEGNKYNELVKQEHVNSSKLFDAKWYINMYPDVAQSKQKPVAHYMNQGWKMGYNPSPLFDNNAYLQDYPDVAAANICPLVHYITHGAKEGRYIRNVTGDKSVTVNDFYNQNKICKWVRNVLEYPINVRDKYDRLMAEIKSLKNNK